MKNRKEVNMYDINMEPLKEYRSISAAVDDTGYHRDTIINSIIEGRPVGCVVFKFKANQPVGRILEKIDIRTMETVEETDSIKMMAEITGENYYKISSCINQEGTTKEGYQYRWREFYDEV